MAIPRPTPATWAPPPEAPARADEADPLRREWLATGTLRRAEDVPRGAAARAQLVAAGVLRPAR